MQAATARPPTESVTRIVMIGGGYTSFGAWRILKKGIRRHLASGRVQVTVISTRNYHGFHGFIGEMISGVVSVAGGLNAAREIFAGARFIMGTVTRVDVVRQEVQVATTGAGDGRDETRAIAYDHLVVGLGARYRRDAVPGLGAFGWALRDVGAVQGLRNHLLECLERADAGRDDEAARRALTFVVAGGGFAGVEITAALGELLRAARAHYPVLERVPPRFVLIHSGDRLLRELASQPRLVRYAEAHLARYGVELRLGTRVARVERSQVTLSTGECIAADTVLSTIGNEVVPLPGLDGLPLDPQRRLKTDAFLQVEGTSGIWAGGDCANVACQRSGLSCPTNALWAMKHGEHIGGNLARLVNARPLKPFTFRGLGVAASMGVGKGMGELFGVPMTGWPAWVGRLMVFLYFMPSRRQALAVLLEHGKLPFCGRGMAPLDVAGPRGGAGGGSGYSENRSGMETVTGSVATAGDQVRRSDSKTGNVASGVQIAGAGFGEIGHENVRLNQRVRPPRDVRRRDEQLPDPLPGQVAAEN